MKMLEIIFTAVLEVAKCLAVPIGRQCSYLCNYESNFDNLERKVRELRAARDKVQRKVDDAISNVEKIEEYVEEWQKTVDEMINRAGNLIEDKAKNTRFKGWMSRYKHSKEASKKVELIAQLLQQEEKFGPVSHPTILPDIRLASSKDYYTFQSRISTSNCIMNAISDSSIHMIGVYGMAGVGKTTLVKKVENQTKKDHCFDEVVFTEVTETPDIKRIRNEIAAKLRLKLENETESERASKLYARLEKAKKILIILDNVWEDIDLEKIGIPFGDDHVGCKLLLTTRDLHVLEKMGSKTNFPIGVLNEKEAWDLFVATAGDVINIRELKSLPNDVCKECGGLPIAIVTVAKALRNKRLPSQWKEALRQLKRPSPDNFKGDLKAAYSKIELSYNYLRGVELKKTFLLCSLMPHYASIRHFLKYAMGLSIFKGIYTMQELRDKVVALIHELKDSCLLLDDGTGEWFSMHDFIRDVAISIAKRDENVLHYRNEIKWEWPDKDELKQCTKIFISDCTIGELREGLKCPRLRVFFLGAKDGDSHVQIPEKFFMEMTKLKVLYLTNMLLFSLRPSLQFLVNLQTLRLDYCKLEDVASIGELKELKVLSLISSNVKLLPIEIGQLTQLRLLDLSYCEQLKVIAPKVISSLSRLEELYMKGSSVLWEDEGLNDETGNSSLEELKHLYELTTLEIDINDEKILPKGLLTKKLERFNISVGDGSYAFGEPLIPNDHGDTVIVESFNFVEHVNLRTLKLKLNLSTIWAEKLQGLNNVEFLCLDKLGGIKNVLYELDKEGFPELKHLHVHNNPNLLGIVDSTKCVHHTSMAFPLLESLVLFNLVNLEKICHGHPSTGSFSNLKFIEVQYCVKLESIFSFSKISRSLPQLQRIKVEDCENMKEIFAVEREDSVNNVSEESGEVFSQLRFLTLRNLPRLANFYSKAQTTSTLQMRQKEFMTNNLQYSNDFNMQDELHTLTPVFNEKVVFPSLEEMKLSGIDFVKIWGIQNMKLMSSSYQNLKLLIVVGCKKLKYVFPSSVVQSFEQLQYLEISHCRVLKEVVAKGEGEEEAIAKFVFPRVTFLKLNNLPELVTFYPGIHTCEWPMLKKLEVCDCDKVKIFTSDSLSFHENIETQHSEPQSIFMVDKINSNVEELTLSRMDNKMIWQGPYPENLFSKFKVLELYNDKSANIPLEIFQRFNNLEKLILREGSYKEIFPFEGDKTQVGIPTQIKGLELRYLLNMICMWKQDSILDSILQDLEVLEVECCDRLINVVPSPTCFKNLRVLKLDECNALTNLVTHPTAKSLVQLKGMEIKSCKMMTEIVANDEEVPTEDEIVFNYLEWLSIEDLESLTCFCSGNFTFKFPSLKELTLTNCPKMETFSEGFSSTPKLEQVQLFSGGEDKEFWDGDLNRTIQQIHKKVVNSKSEELTLNGKDIKRICTDQFPEHQISKVKVLDIMKDESVNIPIEILQRFCNLEKLKLKMSSYKEICSCGNDEEHAGILQHIKAIELCGLFDLKYMWKQDSHWIFRNLEVLEVRYCDNLIPLVPPSTSFENLKKLEVWSCDGLVNLVTSSTAKSLVRLEEMTIVQCEMMIEIVANGGDIEKEDIAFTKLKLLELVCLNSLTSFCSGNYTFKFPSLQDLLVYKCPKMKIFSGGVLSTPRLQKVEKYLDVNEWCGQDDLNTTVKQLHKERDCSEL